MLNIESILQQETNQPFFSRYNVLKDRFFSQEQNYWLANFQGGNDHGPGHLQRVLEHLDQLVGRDPVKQGLLNIYELYLAMMAVLYHDVGLLRGRDKHADTSGLLVGDEANYYIFQNWDLKIIRAVVVSHSSSKDIEQECAMFNDTIQVNQYQARPKVIAALLRLADELDEDSRRADPHVMKKLNLPATSEFFWEFSQRISGITADIKTLEIRIDAAFEKEDILRSTAAEKGTKRPFLLRFAEKLAKINSERFYLGTFLPADLRYRRLVVVVSPLPGHSSWKKPRDFVFTDFTSAVEFVRAFPEMSRIPAAQLLIETLDNIKEDKLEDALNNLSRLEELQAELPPDMVLQVFYDRACVESLRAAKLTHDSAQCKALLDLAGAYLKRWWTNGKQGAWLEVGRTNSNEIYRMCLDTDLGFLLSQRPIEEWIDEDLKKYVPPSDKRARALAPAARSYGGGGGCIPYGCRVLTPNGPVAVESLRVGSQIFSVDTSSERKRLVAKIVNISTSREPRCKQLNGEAVFTYTQPVCIGPETYINASELRKGDVILDAELKPTSIESTVTTEGYYEVFTLTTDHPTHNFIAFNMICKNKMRAPEFEGPEM